MRLKVCTAGELVLRQASQPLSMEELRSRQIQELIEHMRETMHDAPGVGLAAPQVGMPLQLAVIEDKQEYFTAMTTSQLAERQRKPVPFHVIVNPVLHPLGETEIEFFEGCLSVPGFTAVVPRYRRVRVEALDAAGNRQSIEAEGWYARILQHEIDHLHGVLYVDRMQSRSFCTLDNHTRIWKAMSAEEVVARLRVPDPE
jgi:peptide deformylase